MLHRLGLWIHDHHRFVIAAWALALILLKLLAPPWAQVAMDGDLQHLPAETTTARAAQLSATAFPNDRSKSQIVLVVARDETALTAEDRQFALDLGRGLQEIEDLRAVDVWTEKTPVVGSQLTSVDGRAVRVVLRLENEFMATDNIRVLALVEQFAARQREQAPPGLRVGITGSAAIGGDMLSAAAHSVSSTHTTTIILVTIALLAIYRSAWLALVPLLAIGVAASMSIDLLALLSSWSLGSELAWPTIRVFTTTKIFVIVLLFGAGTDYCLFLTARFREHCAGDGTRRESIGAALDGVGMALVASALTTVVGLAMMGCADFGKFTYSGPSIAICLLVTLFACLTLVPALLATRLGAAVMHAQASTRSDWSGRLWEGLAERVLSNPLRVLVVSLLVMAPLAIYGYTVGVTYDLLGELSPQRLSRQGTALLRRHFPEGEIGPLIVLAQHPEGDLDSQDGQFRIAALAKPLDDLPEVVRVRSLYRPTGEAPGSVSVFSAAGIQQLAAAGSPLTKAAFVSQEGPLAGKVTRLILVLREAPFSEEAMAACDKVAQVLDELSGDPNSQWHDAQFELSGTSAGLRDLEQVTLKDRQLIQVLVAAAVFLVIVAILKRPITCLYLIFTVLLSYFVTMGLAGIAFEWMRGEAFVGLDWKVPLFLFVILVAVGQDYNIYLVSRVLEEQQRQGLRAGLRKAIVQTGGIITSCGIIMAGTFVSMTTAELNGMVELGFALSLGILLDTFIVRTVLVPAFLALPLGGPNPANVKD